MWWQPPIVASGAQHDDTCLSIFSLCVCVWERERDMNTDLPCMKETWSGSQVSSAVDLTYFMKEEYHEWEKNSFEDSNATRIFVNTMNFLQKGKKKPKSV